MRVNKPPLFHMEYHQDDLIEVKDDDVKLMEFEDKHGLSDKKYKILYSNRNIKKTTEVMCC